MCEASKKFVKLLTKMKKLLVTKVYKLQVYATFEWKTQYQKTLGCDTFEYFSTQMLRKTKI